MSAHSRKKKLDKGTWFTLIAIGLVVAGMLLEVASVFVSGNTLMFAGAGCWAAAIIIFATLGSTTADKKK